MRTVCCVPVFVLALLATACDVGTDDAAPSEQSTVPYSPHGDSTFCATYCAGPCDPEGNTGACEDDKYLCYLICLCGNGVCDSIEIEEESCPEECGPAPSAYAECSSQCGGDPDCEIACQHADPYGCAESCYWYSRASGLGYSWPQCYGWCVD